MIITIMIESLLPGTGVQKLFFITRYSAQQRTPLIISNLGGNIIKCQTNIARDICKAGDKLLDLNSKIKIGNPQFQLME